MGSCRVDMTLLLRGEIHGHLWWIESFANDSRGSWCCQDPQHLHTQPTFLLFPVLISPGIFFMLQIASGFCANLHLSPCGTVLLRAEATIRGNRRAVLKEKKRIQTPKIRTFSSLFSTPLPLRKKKVIFSH